uniref:Uncharacterized protein n=1 Tax=Ixodes ricinus TaxID=34613 RepID=A0A6B0U586_IXORI
MTWSAAALTCCPNWPPASSRSGQTSRYSWSSRSRASSERATAPPLPSRKLCRASGAPSVASTSCTSSSSRIRWSSRCCRSSCSLRASRLLCFR